MKTSTSAASSLVAGSQRSSLILRLLVASTILLTTITFLLLATAPQCLHLIRDDNYQHDDLMPLRLSSRQQQQHQKQQPAVLSPSRTKSKETVPEDELWEYIYYSLDDQNDISVFDSALHPVFESPTIINKSKSEQSKRRRIRTRLFTFPNDDMKNEPSNEGKQILYDGLRHSTLIDLADVVYMRGAEIVGGGDDRMSDDELWVLDIHHILQGSGRAKGDKMKRPECETLARLLDQAMDGHRNSSSTTNLKILAIDYADNRQVLHCPSLMKRVGTGGMEQNYHLAKRSIVANRHWNETRQFPTSGYFIDSNIATVTANTADAKSNFNNVVVVNNMHHIAYGVRTDLAQRVAHRTKFHFHVDSPWQTNRSSWDVIHLYERTWNKGKGAYYDNLRTSINAALNFINGTQLVPTAAGDESNASSSSRNGSTRSITTFTGKVGLDRNEGRNFVSNAHVDLMLSSKIHVVAQRDAWTDHYRLMEALTSATLVLCDESIVLAKGLRTGYSLVTYNSLQDLREKIFITCNMKMNDKLLRNGDGKSPWAIIAVGTSWKLSFLDDRRR
jgi:hypothetical protein